MKEQKAICELLAAPIFGPKQTIPPFSSGVETGVLFTWSTKKRDPVHIQLVTLQRILKVVSKTPPFQFFGNVSNEYHK